MCHLHYERAMDAEVVGLQGWLTDIVTTGWR